MSEKNTVDTAFQCRHDFMSIPSRAERQPLLFVVSSKPKIWDKALMKSRIIQGVCEGGVRVCQQVCTENPLEGHLVGNGSAFLLHEKGSVSKMSLVTLLLSLKSWEA